MSCKKDWMHWTKKTASYFYDANKVKKLIQNVTERITLEVKRRVKNLVEHKMCIKPNQRNQGTAFFTGSVCHERLKCNWERWRWIDKNIWITLRKKNMQGQPASQESSLNISQEWKLNYKKCER